jgi:CubicO group peptidase (beta-lactamase class C family)
MKTVPKSIAVLAIIAALLVGLASSTGNEFLLKGVWAAYLNGNTSATIGDAKFFDTREIETGFAQSWAESDNFNSQSLSDRLTESLIETESVAFLVVKNDEILHEQYWDGYSESSQSNSFSMAKSITTMLAQCAIQDGLIKSWDQKVVDFLPDLKGEYAQELTLRHLTTMTAGLEFNEHYTNPFDITAKTYYGPDVAKLMLDEVPVSVKPGSFEYQSGATQFLGMAVVEATGKSLAEYASEKLWKPMGANHAAKWHLDNENGLELAFCCFNSNARDFARFGKLMLNDGNWDGTQVLDSAFVSIATQPHAETFYGHGFWIDDSYGTHIFYQRGILGQYIISIPEHDLIIVRLGHQRGENINMHPSDYRVIVEEVLSAHTSM